MPDTQPVPPPLRSFHTTTVLQGFEELGVSLLVPIYQAGKLVILRARDGLLNTHFRAFNRPMGLTVARARRCFPAI